MNDDNTPSVKVFREVEYDTGWDAFPVDAQWTISDFGGLQVFAAEGQPLAEYASGSWARVIRGQA